ncbi:MAG: HAMP domain-containing histidine kinase [Alphaproteobacteria bacterium]|nr:HAMP domain-containing histidine kinase [Alphaproteobacteria bacterium]
MRTLSELPGRLSLRLLSLVPTPRGRPRRYAIAVVLTGAAIALRLAIADQDAGFSFVTFFPAAALTAVIGGFGPGMLATLLGTLAAVYLFIPPLDALVMTDEALWSSLVFIADEILVCGAIGAMHHSVREHVEMARVLREARVGERAARKEAERASAARSRFFAAASHDLRQPLQALRLYIEVLVSGTVGTPLARAAYGADQSLDNAEQLVHSLLDVARIDAGVVKLAPCPVPLRQLLGPLSCEFLPVAAEKGLQLLTRPTELVVRSDPQALERILRNLLANAIRYTSRGGVLIGCRRRGSDAMIEVWDTGEGIPADQLDHIWEEFYQIGNSSRDRSEGLGLGLSIVQKLAHSLDHHVFVESRPGRGSVFKITVPLAFA